MAEHALNGSKDVSRNDADATTPHDVETSPGSSAVARLPYLSRQIRNYLTSLPILVCCFCSGCIDAAVFDAWGVFACIQTGNTIIFSLGAAYLPEGHNRAWLQGLTPVVFFFLGSFFLNRTSRPLDPLRRRTLALSFFTQTVLIVTSAALITAKVLPNIVPEGYEPYLSIIPLAMLAFQAGMQSVTSRQLGLNEIPTTVLTSVYCDLGNDNNLFAPLTKNWPRNRRVAAFALIVLGGIVGGYLSKTDIGMAGALWLAAGLKLCITVAWTVWPEEKVEGKKV